LGSRIWIRVKWNAWCRSDPHHSEQLDPDPDPHQTEKKKTQPQRLSPGDVRLTMEFWRLRIRFKMKARIRNGYASKSKVGSAV
jgi:hypothetical protein